MATCRQRRTEEATRPGRLGLALLVCVGVLAAGSGLPCKPAARLNRHHP
jgi:hypothetical protein